MTSIFQGQPVNPKKTRPKLQSKQGSFGFQGLKLQSKQGSFGFQVYIFIYIYTPNIPSKPP